MYANSICLYILGYANAAERLEIWKATHSSSTQTSIFGVLVLF